MWATGKLFWLMSLCHFQSGCILSYFFSGKLWFISLFLGWVRKVIVSAKKITASIYILLVALSNSYIFSLQKRPATAHVNLKRHKHGNAKVMGLIPREGTDKVCILNAMQVCVNVNYIWVVIPLIWWYKRRSMNKNFEFFLKFTLTIYLTWQPVQLPK